MSQASGFVIPNSMGGQAAQVRDVVRRIVEQDYPWATRPIEVWTVSTVSAATRTCTCISTDATFSNGMPVRIAESYWLAGPLVGDQVLIAFDQGVPYAVGRLNAAPAASLGALQTNVASQYILGTSVGGYVRVTCGATPPANGAPWALVSFAAALPNLPRIALTPAYSTGSGYGDSATTNTFVAGVVTATSLTGFTITGTGAAAANILGWFYQLQPF